MKKLVVNGHAYHGHTQPFTRIPYGQSWITFPNGNMYGGKWPDKDTARDVTHRPPGGGAYHKRVENGKFIPDEKQ